MDGIYITVYNKRNIIYNKLNIKNNKLNIKYNKIKFYWPMNRTLDSFENESQPYTRFFFDSEAVRSPKF